MTGERIQKVLARAGIGSRRRIEQWVREGRLTVNGRKATPGTQVSAGDKLRLDGRLLRLRPVNSAAEVRICHRPSGRDLKDASRPLPGLGGRRWIAVSPLPVKDSGLELLTTDGVLAQALMRRLHEWPVEFAVRVHGDPRLDQLQLLKAGALPDGRALQVDSVELEGGEGINRWFKLTVLGGRARDIHQLFGNVGLQLSRLIRVALGPVRMDRTLSRGRTRALQEEEIAALYAFAGVPRPEESKAAGKPDRAGKKKPVSSTRKKQKQKKKPGSR